jgi:hypothetical protein
VRRGGALARVADLERVLAAGVALGQPGEQQLGVAGDRRQQVVEVVRDAAREAPTASIFCACSSCSSSRRRSVMSKIVPSRISSPPPPSSSEKLPISQTGLPSRRGAWYSWFSRLPSRRSRSRTHLVSLRVRVERRRGLRHRLGRRRVAEHLGEGAVALEQPAACGRAVDTREVALEEEAVSLLGLAQARLHPLAARHVAEHRLRRGRPSNSTGETCTSTSKRRAVRPLADRLEHLRREAMPPRGRDISSACPREPGAKRSPMGAPTGEASMPNIRVAAAFRVGDLAVHRDGDRLLGGGEQLAVSRRVRTRGRRAAAPDRAPE